MKNNIAANSATGRKTIKTAFVLLFLLVIASCSQQPIRSNSPQSSSFESLFNGHNLVGWNIIGDANWQIRDGVIQADQGSGMLVTQNSYQDFRLKLEFWVDETANSGIFIRASNPSNITATNAYEVNIYDTRADQTYRTGGIVNLAAPLYKATTGHQWNNYEIIANGTHLSANLNGRKIVEVEDGALKSGPIGLQFGKGIVKFRNIEISQLN
ncbi:MAG: DUF1080 domain-containing protein [Pseudomonadales bacterium]|nr:DUF1080 domain-containing protein [Pseudomonadales bacterium]